MSLLKNIRFYILLFSFVLSIALNLWVKLNFIGQTLQTIRLTQIYAFTATIFLYLAVMIGPIYHLLPKLPLRFQLNKARRAIGVSAFYFASLHASFAFFGQLGGFAGLPFLDGKFLLGITLSFISLIILSLMAATSFDFMVAKLGFLRWKMLHRLVYLALVLITIHALLLGTHFQDLSGVIPNIFLAALALLLLIEANRFDAFLQRQFAQFTWPHFGLSVLLVLGVIAWYLFFSFGDNGVPSLGIHAYHIQLAKQAQQQAQSSQTNQANLPSYLQGDKTKRYTISFLHPDIINPNQDTKLQFLVFDAANGNPVNFFTKVFTQPMHLIIVDDGLQFFTHIHPDQIPGGFEITTQFPHPGGFHLYEDFQPSGAIEQQLAQSVSIAGDYAGATISAQPIDANLTKNFGHYQVSLSYPQPLQANQISVGQQSLTFTIKDADTYQPVTTLKPYLAAFGHLVMINEQTYDYIHVHPTNLTTPTPDANGGPNVEFLPLGLYGPIKPGIYRIFAQFNPDNHLFTADFTIKIEP